jgi:biopolymer transport protein TolR
MTAVFHGHRKRRKLKADINVVPYIDVMLVLLVIFMVTAPLLTLSVDVKLPSANALATEGSDKPFVVVAYEDGRYGLMLPDETVPAVMEEDELKTRVGAFASERGSEFRIMVAADADVPYQRVIDAMNALKAAQVKNVGLLTNAGGSGG